MAKLEKVVQLNVNSNKNVYSTIHTFLLRKGQDSSNTKGTYERAIRDFFKTMRNKELSQLSEDDIIFKKSQIKSYQVALKEQYKGATVNNAMTAIRECYKAFLDDGFNVDSNWFELERYDEHDSEAYDTLTHDEVLRIIDLVSKTRKGDEKALLIRIAYATAFRKESILTMSFNQIVNIEGQWFLKVIGKGNKLSHKKLSDDLYKTLMEHKERVNRDKIFTLTNKTVTKMMNYIRENMDFGDRKIVFHSLKKASVNAVNILSGGDLKAIQAHGDHADARTTINSYMAKKKLEDLIQIDIKDNFSSDLFDSLSSEELLKLVKSMDRNTQIKLLQKAKLI